MNSLANLISAAALVWVYHVLSRENHQLKCRIGSLEGRVKRLEAQEPTPGAQVEFYITEDGQKKRILFMFLKVTQSLPVSVEFKDKFGNIAKVDGTPSWAVTDESLGTIAPSEDGRSAKFSPSGKAGEVTIQVNADADLGEGVRNILGELAVELIAGDAEKVEIAAGDATDL